ncbi:hypothetical protein IW262DRAFT_1467820 [Armillaria fumosa]|nr:hypothetical protein IW262DRAFT_1467820 [Armillaria fumosa]
MGIQRVTGSFSKIHLPVSGHGGHNKSILHSCRAIEKHCLAAQVIEKEYFKGLTSKQISEIEAQRTQLASALEVPNDNDDFDSGSWEDISDAARLDGVLRGNEVMEISHEGGEFELARELREQLSTQWRKQQTRRDFRTRQNRTQQRINAFKDLLDSMTDAYMSWMLNRDENKSPSVEEECQTSEGTWVLDIFSTALTL